MIIIILYINDILTISNYQTRFKVFVTIFEAEWRMYTCVGNLTIIASDNGLSPDRRKPLSEPMLACC